MTAPAGRLYGKRAPKNAPALAFARYNQAVTLPVFPADDYLSRVPWAGTMNGNDSFGDCVACGAANLVTLFSTIFAGAPIRPTEAEVVVFYQTQNPKFDPDGTADTNGPGSPADGGMDEQTACEELVKNGIKVGGTVYKALGFAKVDHTNLAEIKDAISILGGVMFGVQVAQAQQQQFPGVWNYVPGSPIEGGHCIIGGGHSDVVTDDVKSVCWGAEFGTTDLFLAHQLDECWALVWPWHLNGDRLIPGMDTATFAADLAALGLTFPEPVPPAPAPPVPVPAPPAPAPGPTDPDAALWAELAPWTRERHVTGNKAAAEAVVAWAAVKGYTS